MLGLCAVVVVPEEALGIRDDPREKLPRDDDVDVLVLIPPFPLEEEVFLEKDEGWVVVVLENAPTLRTTLRGGGGKEVVTEGTSL